MVEIEEGAKISILLNDEWVTGTYLGHITQWESDWILLEIGRENPRRVNVGFIQEIEEITKAEVKPLRKKQKTLTILGDA
jgi:hypothetical protein